MMTIPSPALLDRDVTAKAQNLLKKIEAWHSALFAASCQTQDRHERYAIYQQQQHLSLLEESLNALLKEATE